MQGDFGTAAGVGMTLSTAGFDIFGLSSFISGRGTMFISRLGYDRLTECLDPRAGSFFGLAAGRYLAGVRAGILYHRRVAVQDDGDIRRPWGNLVSII